MIATYTWQRSYLNIYYSLDFFFPIEKKKKNRNAGVQGMKFCILNKD